MTTAVSLYDMSIIEIVQIPKMMAQSLKKLNISAQDVIFPTEIDSFISECNQIEMIHFDFATFVDVEMKLQFRKALNGLLGKTAKTLKTIWFPELDVNNREYIKTMLEVPLENLKMCKNLEEINFDLTVQDIQFTLDLPKLRKVKNGEYNAISGKHLLETKLNQLNIRLENETKFHEFLDDAKL